MRPPHYFKLASLRPLSAAMRNPRTTGYICLLLIPLVTTDHPSDPTSEGCATDRVLLPLSHDVSAELISHSQILDLGLLSDGIVGIIGQQKAGMHWAHYSVLHSFAPSGYHSLCAAPLY